MKAAIIWISVLVLMVCTSGSNAQGIDVKLQDQMVTLERDVVRIYNELQKYLLQDFQQDDELLAFESLMAVYVDEILDLYDTYYRINETTLESHQKIVARCLLFRSLTFMERAETSTPNYERACRDYRRALLLVKDHSYEPLLNSTLPYEVWIGDKLYTRIVDLIDNRNKNFQMVNCLKISSGTGKQ